MPGRDRPARTEPPSTPRDERWVYEPYQPDQDGDEVISMKVCPVQRYGLPIS